MALPKYSIIIPVYNRPQEVDELLESLTQQTVKDFEVILVEDGSTSTSERIFQKYSDRLSIHYFFKPNSGPGPSRNFGFERASGNYFVVFDSDCLIPPTYLESVERSLQENPMDAWGGPDRGHKGFGYTQRAMAYTMSSRLTTGGIRGGSSRGFQLRSFNMGISAAVFQKTGGFHFTRLAEDIELSIRISKAGFRIGLIPDAYVFHKRRTGFGDFFKQVSEFGKGRVRVGSIHQGAIKITHWFPAVFLLGLAAIPILLLFSTQYAVVILSCYLIYLFLIALDATVQTKSIVVGILSIPSAFIQLTGYGSGFLKEKISPGAPDLGHVGAEYDTKTRKS